MINELDKKENIKMNIVDSNEGERAFLSSNKIDMRSPSLDLIRKPNAIERRLIKELAEILVEDFLWHQKNNGRSTKTKESSDLL